MKNINKGFVVPLIIALAVIIIGVAVYYYSRPQKPTSYLNSALANKYIVLADQNLWNTKLITTDNPEEWTISANNIVVKIVDSQNNFYCGDKKAVFENYSSFNTGAVGGWGSVSIVDCGSYYFVYDYGDSGPRLYGPFDMQPTPTPDPINKLVTVTYPKEGEKLVIGNTYKITWQNNSGKVLKSIAIQTISQDGKDYGYGNIITSNIPSINVGSVDWKVASTFDPKYNYKLVIFGDKREILGSSNGLFSIVDNRPLSVIIAGGDKIVIDKNNLFPFSKPFTLSGATSQGGSATTYSSSAVIQKIFAQVSIAKFSTDACEVLSAADAPICNVKGEQAVTFDFTAVLSDNSSSWITKRKISLSSKTVKSVQLERTGSNYKIDLVSLDLQNRTASIIISPVINN